MQSALLSCTQPPAATDRVVIFIYLLTQPVCAASSHRTSEGDQKKDESLLTVSFMQITSISFSRDRILFSLCFRHTHNPDLFWMITMMTRELLFVFSAICTHWLGILEIYFKKKGGHIAHLLYRLCGFGFLGEISGNSEHLGIWFSRTFTEQDLVNLYKLTCW